MKSFEPKENIILVVDGTNLLLKELEIKII